MRDAAEQDAASVASQLRAFLSDPARWRPRFAHDLEALPEGAIVLRFAQGKFAQGPMAERDELRHAARAFIREVCFRAGSSHYHVLCVSPGAQQQAIKENYHLMMALIHPDRQDAAGEHWPTDCAQRVNQAYAVLSDAGLRRDYDARLQKLAPEAVRTRDRAARPWHRRARAGPVGIWLAKALVAFTAVAGTLLLLEVWLADPSQQYSMLQGAFSLRGSRDVMASADRPRYIGSDAGTASQRPPEVEALAPSTGFSLLRPLWRAFAAAEAEKPVVAPPPTQVAPKPVAPGEVGPAQGAAAAARPATRAPQVVMQASANFPVRTKELALAQAPPAPPAPASTVSSQDIELVVARFIGYYEAGETDKLMSLLDSSAAGFWQTARTRQAYLEFFRTTRQRKLRVNHLAWQSAPDSAYARGDATVFAEYVDEPGTLERRVDVEMDIAMRDGTPKITRLSLFPDAR